MADKSGKPDWLKHAKQYKRLQASSGMKIKEYAALHGLNEHSARRAINEVIKKLNAGDTTSDKPAKGDQKPAKRGRPKKGAEAAPGGDSDEGEGEPDTLAHASTGAHESDQKGRKSSPKPPKKSDQNSDQKNEGKKRGRPSLTVVTGEVISLPKNKGGAPKGSDNALSTGKKKRPRQQDADKALEQMKAFTLADNWQDTLESMAVTEIMTHMNLTLRARDKSMSRLLREEMEAADNEANPPPPVDGETVQFPPTPAEFKQLKLLTETSYALTDLLRTATQLLGRIQKERRDDEAHTIKLEAHSAKLIQAEQAHQLRMYGKMKGPTIAKAYAMMQEEGGSAIAAAQFLEAEGIPLPDTIKRFVDLEMEMEKSKVDESTGISNKELDEYVAAAEAKRAGHHQWLTEQRAAIAAVVEEFGYGDIDTAGVRRSDEIAAPFEAGEEIDYSATADLYVEDAKFASIEAEERAELPPEQESDEQWRGEGQFNEEEEEEIDERIDDFRVDN